MMNEETINYETANEITGASIGGSTDEAPSKTPIDTYVQKVNTENFLELYTNIIEMNYSEEDIRKFMKAFNRILTSLDVEAMKINDEYIIPKIVRDSIIMVGNFTLNEAIKESSITTGILETVKKVRYGEYLNALKCVTNITTDIFKYIEGAKDVTKKEK